MSCLPSYLTREDCFPLGIALGYLSVKFIILHCGRHDVKSVVDARRQVEHVDYDTWPDVVNEGKNLRKAPGLVDVCLQDIDQ